MTFQLFNGRRAERAMSNGHQKPESPWATKAINSRDRVMPSRSDLAALGSIGSAQAPRPDCCVEQACAAFHDAQDSIVAQTKGAGEVARSIIADDLARRDVAFQQIRAHVARTRGAWRAKLSVLLVMQEWFGGENPDLSSFAFEVAIEAAAVFDDNPNQDRVCRDLQQQDLKQQARDRERWTWRAWLGPKWDDATNTPFAN